MGCLNSAGQFEHWFGNIHLSGMCNRRCYFCIGQHMMSLDHLDVLDTWPLPNIDLFIERCLAKGVKEINVTGSNTDPLLFKHTAALKERLLADIPDLVFGLRTNGAGLSPLDWSEPTSQSARNWRMYDKGSVSITSLNEDKYKATMGTGSPPNMATVLRVSPFLPKINIVLCPETCVNSQDFIDTIVALNAWGIKKINLREPYGQPHIGNPFELLPDDYDLSRWQTGEKLFGMPVYNFQGTEIVYWDVHYVEVESVNLYANGEVSETYPVTKGHDPVNGKVEGQEHFIKSGRVREQWVKLGVDNGNQK